MELRFRRKKSAGRKETEVPETGVIDNVQPPEAERPVITDLANFLKRTQTLLPLAVLSIAVLAFIGFLYWARPFFMPVVLALLVNFLLRPIVKFLARLHVPEILGALAVMAAFFTGIGFMVTHLAQPATEWAASAPETLRKVEKRLQGLVRPAAQLSKAAEEAGSITEPSGNQPVQKVEVRDNKFGGVIFGYASSFVTAAVETLVLVFFFLAVGDTFIRKLVKILPTLPNKKKAVEIAHEVQQSISAFLFTITCINVSLGVVVALSVSFLGMPNPVLWGVLAALLNYVPYFGPWIGVVILALAGLVTFDSVAEAILPPILYLAAHTVESNFITPMVLGRRLTLNPVIIFLSLMFWMWLWGIGGALLSVPLLMIFKIFCDHFRPLAPIGEFISGDEKAGT